MKSAFTDSLFSAEDEAFLLKRLVVLSQHPVLSIPEKLFYIDCILHFPENRPISCGDSDEALPVLLTPQLASALLPTMFNDGPTLLARLHLLSLVYLEEGELVGGGLTYLYNQLISLLSVVGSGGNREIVVTFFRAVFLFLLSFSHVERFCSGLSRQLCQLYLQHPQLAPHLINVAHQTRESLSESGWALELLRGLQKVITEGPLTQLPVRALSWHLKVLARVAEEAEICQLSSLSFLSSIISPSSGFCADGDWRLGNDVLRVCRCLLLHPTVDSLLLPLADILQQLARRYGDTDIQDHARLYYTLLTTLSQEKLAAMLAPSQGGPQVKKRTLSCLMAESEGLTSTLTVHRMDRPVLRLIQAAEQPTETKTCVPDQNELQEPLETYRAQFTEPHFASEMTLKYQLTHTEDSDPRFHQIFSIRLHFCLTNHHYEQLEDISVSCLFKERPPPVVQLRLKPRQPYPNTLQVSAIFTTCDGLTWLTDLPNVHVAFQQLFLPLPAPPAWSPGCRLKLFQELWDHICSESRGGCSLFCCQLRGVALRTLLNKYLFPFLLSDPCSEEFQVLLYLPPQNHMMLSIRAEEDAVHFNIATDNWQLLPHLNSYLLSITSSQHAAS